MFTENPRYRWFGDNDRHFRRTIADAIEVLFSIPTFTAQSHATVRVAPLCLPSKKTVGLVNVEFDGPLPEITSVVAMPTCAHFRGVQASSQQQKCYDIFRLDQATIDATHRVRLADGTCLCAVELLPAQLPLEPSELDWRIVWLAIAFLGAEKKCCPSLSWTVRQFCLGCQEHRSTNGLRSGLRNSIKLRNGKTATSAALPRRPIEFRRTTSDSHPSRRCTSPATASNGTPTAVTAGNSTNIREPGRRIACPRMTISHSGRALLALRYCCAGRKVSFLIRKQLAFSHISDGPVW